MEAVVFPRVYDRAIEVLREDAILIVEGKVDTRSERPQIVVDRVEEWTRPPGAAPPPVVTTAATGGATPATTNGAPASASH